MSAQPSIVEVAAWAPPVEKFPEIVEAIKKRDTEASAVWFAGKASATALAMRDRRWLLAHIEEPVKAYYRQCALREVALNEYSILFQRHKRFSEAFDAVVVAVRALEMDSDVASMPVALVEALKSAAKVAAEVAA